MSTIEIPTKQYGALLADPPWHWRSYSAKGTGRGAVSHYDTMSMEQIAELPVGEFAAKDAVLFLWVIDSMLPEGLQLVKAWGFKYKCVGFVWAKTWPKADHQCLSEQSFPMGTGYWTRANPELCLLATKGSPKTVARNVRRLIISPRREHSRNPDEIFSRLERLVNGP